MPSISSAQLATGLDSWMYIHGETVTALTGPDAGSVFKATILTTPSIDIETGDTREKISAHFKRTACPRLDKTGQLRDSSGNVWRTIKRTDNPADNTTDFELVRIVTGKDL